ncbi:hypothetical protein [Winogradskyella ursingii]|uniref:hypothetical protein n=1 Tax=Winogradskyella ursingii TaxID=2686079 RepID=UPI0015CED950|nr:hypothetical protein [Winogradskyella ursingii]
MVDIRQPEFKFEEEEEPTFDWENLDEEGVNEALKTLDEFDDPERKEINRYNSFIPDYANTFIKKYLNNDNDKLGPLGNKGILSIWNYLEYGFEVEINNLEIINDAVGIVEFSTGNFPFGGMERFLITLKAFDLIPIECFDGFSIVEIDWINDFEYNSIKQPEKTNVYLKK